MTTEVIEGNKLIAWFFTSNKNHPESETFYLPDFDDFDVEPWIHQNRLWFHKEWGWLMPAYIRINKLICQKLNAENGYGFNLNLTTFQFNMWKVLESEDCDIKELWDSIVKFLKWYNTQIN